ncbi:MAG: DUF4316 domain-containing protein [Oscillospiraceae bacterium]|nr:DUF4316 domain-containing protein [Oscillospiraceae bacterium]
MMIRQKNRYLVSPGYTTCTCESCGLHSRANYTDALGHSYATVVTAPTCTEMGYTTYTCVHCDTQYRDQYTAPTGHSVGDWIVDREADTEAEGLRHRECAVCGLVLTTEVLEKLYVMATTDSRGVAVVGVYLVTVTDTDTGNPVANATVVLGNDGAISVRLPDGRLLDYAARTTVTVLLAVDRTPVQKLPVLVTDGNGNYAAAQTDEAGQLTVPGDAGVTGPDGRITVGWIDADGNRYTLTLEITDDENGRPIRGVSVTVGKTGNILVLLPDGIDMDEANRILLLLTDKRKTLLPGWVILVKGDRNQGSGTTDRNGRLVLPERAGTETHGAYIVGYPDGSFGPERSMTRAEATVEANAVLLDTYPMPDDSVNMGDLEGAGYLDGDMLPISRDRAYEMMEQGFTVYGIVDGGAAELCLDSSDIDALPLDALFSVPKEEWEESTAFDDKIRERMDRQEEREAAFLACPGDAFAIYQVKHTDELSVIRYESMENLQSMGQQPQRGNYDLVYARAGLPEGQSPDAILDKLWEDFNIHRPVDYHSPSMSVSDIVAIKQGGEVSYHYCDSVGFQKLPGFNQPENNLKAAEMALEDDYGMIDGIINNGPRQPIVAELEDQVKAGQTISLMALYHSTGTRAGLIAELTQMRGYLGDEDSDLRALTDSAIGKLEAMTDEDYAALDLTPDFDAEDNDGA